MTNPTLEQRAREIATDAWGRWFDRGAKEHWSSWVIPAMLTFSHTGVEQAIEACAKVCDEAARGRLVGGKEPPDLFDRGRRHQALKDAAAIRATLPAQSPDDIAYAGAVQGETVALPLPGEGDGE